MIIPHDIPPEIRYPEPVAKTALRNEKIPRLINRILLILSAAMVFLLLIGTIYAFARAPDAQPLFAAGSPRPSRASNAKQGDDIRVFAGLGRLRILLSNSTTLLLTITFPYAANDIPFTEELAAKLGDLKATATRYFSELAEAEIIQIDEDAAKQEILKRFNSSLRLGRITTLYFSDMLVID